MANVRPRPNVWQAKIAGSPGPAKRIIRAASGARHRPRSHGSPLLNRNRPPTSGRSEIPSNVAAGLSRSTRFVPPNIGIRARISRLRSGVVHNPPDRMVDCLRGDLHPERDDGEFRVSPAVPAHVDGDQAIPDRLVPLAGPKLRLPPIMTKPPPRLLTSSTVHSSCSAVNAPSADVAANDHVVTE